ncbi:uncharacterized protein LOC118237296 [Anguilla anguilla]|uniref:uncharacterized protein LOC118237296 n=1 Tax=Anguilla anguilla TaxID=7936 RepID=UPI0015B1AC6D|nr:uncharacterized protein LOC118237296 [Anguilla anguilla]
MKGKLLLSTLGKPAKGEKESCPSSSLFIPFGKEMPLLRWSRKDSKDVNSMSTDTEDMNSVKVNRGQKKTKEQHCSRAARKKSNMEEHLTEDYVTSGKKQGVHIKKSRCVMSNKKETCKLEKETEKFHVTTCVVNWSEKPKPEEHCITWEREKESCPSSSLFIPFGKEMPLSRWSRKHSKDVNSMSTDTEDMNSVKVNRGQKKTKEQHCSRAARKKSNMEEHLSEDHVTSGKKQGVHIKKSRCVMSNKKETCKLEKETVEERHQLWKETAVRDLCGDMSNSELELSDDSESILYSKNTSLLRDLRGEDEGSHSHVANGAVSTFGSSRLGYSNSLDLNQLYTECKEMTMSQEEKEHNLETQVEAMISMLESCDLVEQLVLRNTGITDELLNCLVTALKNSPSEVVLINLNLNNIGPPGVQILLNLVKLNPQVKGLL